MSKKLKEEKKGKTIGKIRDRIFVDGELVEDTGFRHNVIVSDINNLIAVLMSGKDGTMEGITYWAVGEGDPVWDTSAPPSGNVTDTQLVNEIDRKAVNPEDIEFLDADDNVVAGITNKLQIVKQFEETFGNGKWLELGLFGGDATSTANSGFMVNHLNHPVIEKRDNMTIERTLIIEFA